jgi:tetratricopeptide (TPR) repeat protein
MGMVRLALLATGCMAATPAAAAPSWADLPHYQQKLQSEGDQNRVLNEMEIGTRELWTDNLDEAAAAFTDAIGQIELVYKKDANADRARSLWHDEGAKSFKGEPYERAMAYCYRGLVYLRRGDYENARAAFREGQLQDAFAEEQQNQTDFALLLFLEAWASHLNHDIDLRDEALRHLKQLRPEFPGIADGDDTLVLVETGSAPRKLGDGSDHSYFVFRRGKGFKENRVRVQFGDTSEDLFPIEDIFYQATTRGGREIDKILKGKAEFRSTTAGISSALADTSVTFSQMGGSGTIAGVGVGISAIAAFAAFKARPQADTRYWSSLPDIVHIRTFSSKAMPAGEGVVHYLTGDAPGAQADDVIHFQTDPNGHRMAMVRSR